MTPELNQQLVELIILARWYLPALFWFYLGIFVLATLVRAIKD